MFKFKKIFAIAIVGLLINKSNGETVIINDNGNWSGEIEIDEKGYWYSFISDVEERTVEQKGDNQGTLSLKFFGDVDPIITKEGSNTITVTDKLDDDAGTTIERSISFTTSNEVIEQSITDLETKKLSKKIKVDGDFNKNFPNGRHSTAVGSIVMESLAWGPNQITKWTGKVATVLSLAIPQAESLGINQENLEEIYRFFSNKPKGSALWKVGTNNSINIWLKHKVRINLYITILYDIEEQLVKYHIDKDEDGISEGIASKKITNEGRPYFFNSLEMITIGE